MTLYDVTLCGWTSRGSCSPAVRRDGRQRGSIRAGGFRLSVHPGAPGRHEESTMRLPALAVEDRRPASLAEARWHLEIAGSPECQATASVSIMTTRSGFG